MKIKNITKIYWISQIFLLCLFSFCVWFAFCNSTRYLGYAALMENIAVGIVFTSLFIYLGYYCCWKKNGLFFFSGAVLFSLFAFAGFFLDKIFYHASWHSEKAHGWLILIGVYVVFLCSYICGSCIRFYFIISRCFQNKKKSNAVCLIAKIFAGLKYKFKRQRAGAA